MNVVGWGGVVVKSSGVVVEAKGLISPYSSLVVVECQGGGQGIGGC